MLHSKTHKTEQVFKTKYTEAVELTHLRLRHSGPPKKYHLSITSPTIPKEKEAEERMAKKRRLSRKRMSSTTVSEEDKKEKRMEEPSKKDEEEKKKEEEKEKEEAALTKNKKKKEGRIERRRAMGKNDRDRKRGGWQVWAGREL